MPGAFTIRVLDSIIRIEFDETLGAQSISALQSPWRALEVPDAPDKTLRVVADGYSGADGAVVVRVGDLDRAAESLTTTLTVEGIAGLRGHALLLHAAGIALDDGRVIGFVGPSGRGKTTASRVLAQNAGYVTDETLAVRDDLSVIPYPKPLSVLAGPPPKRSIAPEALGMKSVPTVPLRLAALALLDRRPEIADAYVERVDLSEAIGLVVPETSSLVALPRPLRGLIDAIEVTGGVRRVVYSEADQLPALLPDLLALAAPSRKDVADAVAHGVADSVGSGNDVHRRAPFRDAVRIGSRLAIHDGAHVIVLDGLGPDLWESADGVSHRELVARVTRLNPPPPDIDADAEIQRQLDALTAAGILLRG